MGRRTKEYGKTENRWVSMFISSDLLCHLAQDVKKHITDSGKLTLSSDLSSNFSDAREIARLPARRKIEVKFYQHKNTSSIKKQ